MENSDRKRPRARELDIAPGLLPPGPLNAITDISGVQVGHLTLIKGRDIRTGVTAILPHKGSLYQWRVPAGLAVGNGFGKLMGSTQLVELGEIETPIVLTNTLAVAQAAEAIITWTLTQPGNEEVRSVNPVVGETNDSRLNNMRKRPVTAEHVLQAIRTAEDGPVAEGCVGAGTGTVTFGWKGGIGTSSRRLPPALGDYTVGVLVQSNFGGALQIMGLPVGHLLGRHYLDEMLQQEENGSVIMVVATDAPLSDRNLTRLARRALAGMARTGASMNHRSGDYALAFSTSTFVRRTPRRRRQLSQVMELPNDRVSPLFQAAIEATEEAILNSLLQAKTTIGRDGTVVEALPVDAVVDLLSARGNR